MEHILPGPFRRIEGPLRPKFKDLVPRDQFQDYRMKPDVLYLTIDYYLDLDLYFNYQNRALSSFVSRELNPQAFDSYGNFNDDEFERLKIESRYIWGPNYDHKNCDVVRFFTIEGAEPLADVRDMMNRECEGRGYRGGPASPLHSDRPDQE